MPQGPENLHETDPSGSNNCSFRMLKHEYSYIGGRKSAVYANNGNWIIQGETTEILTGLLPVYGNKLECVVMDFSNHNQFLTQLMYASDLLQDAGILFVITSTALYTSAKSEIEKLYGPSNMVADFTNHLYNHDTWETQHLLVFYKGSEQGHNTAHLNQCFSGKQFSNMRPTDLIQYCMYVACSKEAILLSSICGYDDMAAPVLQLNKLDGGNRKFLLVYPMNYSNHATSIQLTFALETDFDCYTPGDCLFIPESSGQLNTALPVKQIRAYIWYTETGIGFINNVFSTSEPYLLGILNNTAIYLIYEHDAFTILNETFLLTMKTTAGKYIVYADQCSLSSEQLRSKKILFKQFPRNSGYPVNFRKHSRI